MAMTQHNPGGTVCYLHATPCTFLQGKTRFTCNMQVPFMQAKYCFEALLRAQMLMIIVLRMQHQLRHDLERCLRKTRTHV